MSRKFPVLAASIAGAALLLSVAGASLASAQSVAPPGQGLSVQIRLCVQTYIFHSFFFPFHVHQNNGLRTCIHNAIFNGGTGGSSSSMSSTSSHSSSFSSMSNMSSLSSSLSSMSMSSSLMSSSHSSTGSSLSSAHASTGSSLSSSSHSSIASSSSSMSGTSVSITASAFVPRTVTVRVGSVVTWTNNDTGLHTVTFNPSGPSSGIMQPGDSHSFLFTGTGTFAYHCAIHPSMTGSVIVTP